MENTVEKNLSIIDENEKLIANILHDIKSPLYSIKIGLQAHLDTELNKDIFETATNIIDYIENFLVNYSFKQGKFNNKIDICDIKEIVFRKIESYKYIFIDKNIHIDVFCNDDDYKINSIQIFLSSIIGNLVSNIAHHAKENERAEIEIYKKQNDIFVDFKNKYSKENNKTSLGLDFCKNLAQCCKVEFKFLKTKSEIKASLRIPNLNY
ncbi:MAG: hypothetical protein IJ877_06630 [Candidatus Gastranaerophilales bacterium]|nr:hypothetical protein [Candidatus Gastranaerophilales bacterium]